MDCKFVRTRKDALRRNTDPRMKSQLIFNENLSIAFMRKKSQKLNQSWAVGFSILEISKFIMQSLMYIAVRPAFEGRVTTILSDTDSWILALPAGSADEAVEKMKSIMDFSNYASSHPLHSIKVKNRTGYLKNEMPGEEITEVVAVRSKTYAVKSEESVSSKCKGVKRVAKNKIPFSAFVKCVNETYQHSVTQHTIQSKKHTNRLMKCNKVAFSSFDDKRHLLCGVHSVPYGSAIIAMSRKMNQCFFCANPQLMF